MGDNDTDIWVLSARHLPAHEAIGVLRLDSPLEATLYEDRLVMRVPEDPDLIAMAIMSLLSNSFPVAGGLLREASRHGKNELVFSLGMDPEPGRSLAKESLESWLDAQSKISKERKE